MCPEIFQCIEIFCIFQDLEQLQLALKTEFALNFSSGRGAASPPPCTPLVATVLSNLEICGRLTAVI